MQTEPEFAPSTVASTAVNHDYLKIELFSRATELKIPRTNFVDVYSYGWLPYDYLSACYLAKQEHAKALEAAIAAHERYPRDARLEANINFLRKLAGSNAGGQP